MLKNETKFIFLLLNIFYGAIIYLKKKIVPFPRDITLTNCHGTLEVGEVLSNLFQDTDTFTEA